MLWHTHSTHHMPPHHILHILLHSRSWRPTIFVSLLPTFECVLYGTNILGEDVGLTHPSLDIIIWHPYGIGHFTIPFVVATFLWLFCTKQALHVWARSFGNMNMVGVIIQILLPCSASWYELIHGLTPANNSIKCSPGGLARIDALFHFSTFRTLLISCRPTCGPSNLRNHWCPVNVSASFDGGLVSTLEVPLTFMTTRPMFPLWVV